MTASRKIATEDIFVARGVRAFTAGSVVPDSVVKALGIESKVAGQNTKAAAEAVKAPAKPEV